jgi:hypothetical protein
MKTQIKPYNKQAYKSILSDHRNISCHLRGIFDEVKCEVNIFTAELTVAKEIIQLSQNAQTPDEKANLQRAISPLLKFQ